MPVVGLPKHLVKYSKGLPKATMKARGERPIDKRLLITTSPKNTSTWDKHSRRSPPRSNLRVEFRVQTPPYQDPREKITSTVVVHHEAMDTTETDDPPRDPEAPEPCSHVLEWLGLGRHAQRSSHLWVE